MPPPLNKTCDFPGCQGGPVDDNGLPTAYVTAADCHTRADMTDDLKTHINAAHTLPLQLQQDATNRLANEAKKIEAEAMKIRAERVNTSTPATDSPAESIDGEQSSAQIRTKNSEKRGPAKTKNPGTF